MRKALQTVRAGLRFLCLPEMTLGTVEIVLAEVMNNVVEHAYQNTGQGVIGLTCRARGGLLMFELSDYGQPMPGLSLPGKKHHALCGPMSELPEGGFGWGLIRDMTLSLSYRRWGGRNLLRFTLAKDAD